jgi:hypothetical protein
MFLSICIVSDINAEPSQPLEVWKRFETNSLLIETTNSKISISENEKSFEFSVIYDNSMKNGQYTFKLNLIVPDKSLDIVHILFEDHEIGEVDDYGSDLIDLFFSLDNADFLEWISDFEDDENYEFYFGYASHENKLVAETLAQTLAFFDFAFDLDLEINTTYFDESGNPFHEKTELSTMIEDARIYRSIVHLGSNGEYNAFVSIKMPLD